MGIRSFAVRGVLAGLLIGALSMPMFAAGSNEKDARSTKSVLELEMWEGQKGTYRGNVKEDIVKEAIASITGVKVTKVTRSDQLSDLEKFNLLFAAQEVPALMHLGLGSERTPIIDQLEQADYLYKFSDAELEKKIPDLYAAVAPAAWEIWKQNDGKIAGILNRAFGASPAWAEKYPEWTKKQANGNFNDINIFAIRDDILKAIFPNSLSYDELQAKLAKNGTLTLADFEVKGLDSFEQLVTFLYKVKENYGSQGVIPIGVKNENTNDAFFDVMSRAFNGSNMYVQFNPVTLEPHAFPFTNRDAFVKFMKKWNKLYLDGILDPEFAIMKRERIEEKRNNGVYAVYPTWNVEVINGKLAAAGKSFKVRPVVISYKTGDMVFDGYYKTEPTRVTSAYYLNKKKISAQEIDRVLGYLNYFATDQGQKMMVWGPKESGLWTESNGKRTWVDPKFTEVFQGAARGQIKDFEYYGIYGIGRDFHREEYWFVHNHRHPVYYPTFDTAATTDLGQVLTTQSVVADKKGFFQDDHAAWNGKTATNTIFWSAWSKLKDQQFRIVLSSDDSEFEKGIAAFYDIYYKDAQFKTYWEEQTSKMKQWWVNNKNKIQFHPKADLSKIK